MTTSRLLRDLHDSRHRRQGQTEAAAATAYVPPRPAEELLWETAFVLHLSQELRRAIVREKGGRRREAS